MKDLLDTCVPAAIAGSVVVFGIIFLMLLQIGFYSFCAGCLFYLSDWLIGSTLFAWNYILLGGLVVFFIKLLFGKAKEEK